MSVRTLTKSFAGGEVTPEFYGRLDDPKFQTGLATARNCIIKPHGPAANRPGTTYVLAVKDSTKKTRVIPFVYSTDQTFSLELGVGYFRFHTNGSTLLAGSPAAYAGGTAYNIGDLVSSSGVNYYCIQAGTGHTPVSSPTYWYPLPSTAYEIPNPYAEADLFSIHYVQSNDVLTLVHPNYAPMELRRMGATDWVLSTVSFVSTLVAPTSPSAVATVATGTGLATMSYVISSVDSTGIEESLPSSVATCSNNLLTTGNYNTITCSTMAGAVRYNFYKLSNGLYGFIGQASSASFIDNNITADVSKTPPIQNNPFSGASNYPGAVGYFQQRRDFAGTINQPQNIWMTRTGTESNLSYSIPTHNDDSINFKISAREANTIRHIVPMASMILLTSAAEYRVTSINSDAITPTSVSVTPQSYIGANNAVPVIVNYNLLFAAARGGHLREMAYAWQYSGYITGDLSLRAPHLFDGYDILDLAYAKCPYPIVWAVSSSGDLLSFTYVPEQQVGAWAHHDTVTLSGESVFESVCVVPEGSEDAVYVVVKRFINGSYVRYIERFASFLPNTVLADCYFVDAGAAFSDPLPITGLTKANPIVATVAAHGYSNGAIVDFDSIVGNNQTPGFEQLNGLRFVVAGVTTNTYQLTSIDDGSNIDGTAFATYVSGGTSSKADTTFSSGLSHLEGETVSILGNGAVFPQQKVTGGAIVLDQAVSKLSVGLPITADLQTLPLSFETEAFGQGRMKNVDRAWLRVFNSSGIFAGPTFDDLTEAKQRTTETYGNPPSLKTDEIEIDIDPKWGSNGQLCIRQSDPLPLILTAITLETDIGA